MKITKKLINEIVQVRYKLQDFYDEDPVRPVPGPPATTKELAALESYLRKRELAFPHTYREFLSVSNGLSEFDSHLSLLSTAAVMSPPNRSIERRYPTLSRFIIGTSNGLQFIAFDPETESEGEMEVVWVTDDGQEARYSDFGKMLQDNLEQMREAIESEEADRRRLKD